MIVGGLRLERVDAALGWLVDVPAALLVLADIVVLFSGVFARFVLHRPLVWSDELASLLFLLLALLGRLTPPRRAVLEATATAACLAFLTLVVWPAWQYAADERAITTPALEISNVWRAAALPIGVALMAIFAVLRLLRFTTLKDAMRALFAVAAIVGGFWLLGPILARWGRLNLLIFFVGVAGGSVLAGIPIAFAFGLGTFGYLALTTSTPLPVIVGRMDEGMSHLILLAVPLFVFLGLLIEMTGMARAMVAFLGSLLGHVKGGLSYVLVGAMYLVS